MRTFPRARLMVRWSLTAALVVAVVVWVGSYVLYVIGPIPATDLGIVIGGGRFLLLRGPFVPRDSLTIGHSDFSANLDWFMLQTRHSGLLLGCHLWVPATGLFVLAGSFWSMHWWRLANRKKGCCVHCGYDLKGLAPHTLCPECGRDAPPLPS